MHSVYGQPKYAQKQAQMNAELQRLRLKLDVTSDDPPL